GAPDRRQHRPHIMQGAGGEADRRLELLDARGQLGVSRCGEDKGGVDRHGASMTWSTIRTRSPSTRSSPLRRSVPKYFPNVPPLASKPVRFPSSARVTASGQTSTRTSSIFRSPARKEPRHWSRTSSRESGGGGSVRPRCANPAGEIRRSSPCS